MINRNTPTQILLPGVAQIAAGLWPLTDTQNEHPAYGLLVLMPMDNWVMELQPTETHTQILASGCTQIAAGNYHSLILKSDGSLHTFGMNNYGQLGDGSTTNSYSPTQILASGVAQIAAGLQSLTHSQRPTEAMVFWL